MDVKMSLSMDGNIKFSTKSERTRIDDPAKFLSRNPDAILVKLSGSPDPSMKYHPGHVCGMEEDNGNVNVFVGNHLIGQLPAEAIDFAEQVGSNPEFLIAIVGKIDDDGNIYIYVAE